MAQQDAIVLLKADHATVKTLFAQEEKAAKHDDHGKYDGQEKLDIFNRIKAALTVHATIEEEIFYPAVKKARSENVKDEVREGYEEHRQIKSLLVQIAAVTPDDETYDMKIKVLKEDVEHHVKEEEGEMFPDAKKFLGEKRLIETRRKTGSAQRGARQEFRCWEPIGQSTCGPNHKIIKSRRNRNEIWNRLALRGSCVNPRDLVRNKSRPLRSIIGGNKL